MQCLYRDNTVLRADTSFFLTLLWWVHSGIFFFHPYSLISITLSIKIITKKNQSILLSLISIISLGQELPCKWSAGDWEYMMNVFSENILGLNNYYIKVCNWNTWKPYYVCVFLLVIISHDLNNLKIPDPAKTDTHQRTQHKHNMQYILSPECSAHKTGRGQNLVNGPQESHHKVMPSWSRQD